MEELPIGLLCPMCSAASGEPCTNAVHRVLRVFHAQRWKKMRQAASQAHESPSFPRGSVIKWKG